MEDDSPFGRPVARHPTPRPQASQREVRAFGALGDAGRPPSLSKKGIYIGAQNISKFWLARNPALLMSDKREALASPSFPASLRAMQDPFEHLFHWHSRVYSMEEMVDRISDPNRPLHENGLMFA